MDVVQKMDVVHNVAGAMATTKPQIPSSKNLTKIYKHLSERFLPETKYIKLPIQIVSHISIFI